MQLALWGKSIIKEVLISVPLASNTRHGATRTIEEVFGLGNTLKERRKYILVSVALGSSDFRTLEMIHFFLYNSRNKRIYFFPLR